MLLMMVMLIKLILAYHEHKEMKNFISRKIQIMGINHAYGNNEITLKDWLNFLIMVIIPMCMTSIQLSSYW